MERLGFNINMRNSYREIQDMGTRLLGTGKFSAIEITYSEHMRHVNTSRYNQELKMLIDHYTPEIIVHISDFNIAEENEVLKNAILSEFEYCCRYLVMLGGKKIVMHGGSRKMMHISIYHEDGTRQTKDEVYRKLWGLSIETMREACDIAQKYGITVYTENLSPDKLIVHAHELVDYIKEVDRENLKAVFDVGHSYCTGHNIVSELGVLGDFLGHLHIHDNHGEKDEHLEIGKGSIDWDAFRNRLSQQKFSGVITMELYRTNVEKLEESYKYFMSSE